MKKHLRHIVGFGTVIRRADKAAFLEDFEKLAQRVEEFKKKVATALNAKLNERRHP